jgi:hypothetical protein
VKNVEVALTDEKGIVGIPPDELIDVNSVDDRNPVFLHLAMHEEHLGSEILGLFLAHSRDMMILTLKMSDSA